MATADETAERGVFYVVSRVLVVAGVLGLGGWFHRTGSGDVGLALYFAAVVAAGWRFGRGAGLAASLVGSALCVMMEARQLGAGHSGSALFHMAPWIALLLAAGFLAAVIEHATRPGNGAGAQSD